MAQGEPLLTSRDVMERLGLSRTTLWRMVKDRQIESVRIGRHIRFTTAAVDRFIRKRTTPAK